MSQISLADVAVTYRDHSRTGVSLTCGGESIPRDRAMAMPAACPRQGTAAVHHGSGSSEAGQAAFTWQQRDNSKNYTHTTRIASAVGGALGSHPARDPV